MTDTILKILEIIGIIAFAVSGALVAIKVGFDIFGVIVLSCTTSFGGGILRDILIGRTPPAIFSNVYLLLIATCVAITVFVIVYFRKDNFKSFDEYIEKINNYFDAVGLAVFTIMGVEIAFACNLSSNVFLSVVLGLLTGVGGGLLRDIFSLNLPYIFKKHVYAMASIAGAIVYYILRIYINIIVATVIGALLIVTLRVLATIYRWNLPRIVLDKKENKL